VSAEPDPFAPMSQSTEVAQSDSLSESLRDATGFETLEGLWQAVQRSIQDRLGLERFSVWFRQTELMSADDERLVVGVPNVIIQQFVSVRYTEAVEEAVGELVGRPMRVAFDVAPRLFREMRARQEEDRADAGAPAVVERAARAPASARRPPTDWGFENLIVTGANRLPFAAARELAGQETARVPFIYVCGGYGTGKTALLRAMYALASGPERRLDAVIMSAEDWCNQFYHAIQRRYRSCDILILDDIQFFEGKASGQGELLHTVKHVLEKGGRVALAGMPHPRELVEVDPALVALLDTAFPAVLTAPRPDEQADVVKALAAARQLDAVEEVWELIAGRFGGSMSSLEAAVSRLALYAAVEGCGKVELAQARAAFNAMLPSAPSSVEVGAIRRAVCDEFGVGPEQLLGRSRLRTVCRARHIAIYLTSAMTDLSLNEIGRAFGGLSHSSVKYAADKVAGELEADPELRPLIERLKARLARP
jgi:chromosomal replication initiator protein